MDQAPSAGPVVVDELKKQAREEGYFVIALSAQDVTLLWVYVMGILLGLTLAAQ